MTAIVQKTHELEFDIETTINTFIAKHIYITFLAMLIGMPISILFLVFIFTTLIVLPFGLILGWN